MIQFWPNRPLDPRFIEDAYKALVQKTKKTLFVSFPLSSGFGVREHFEHTVAGFVEVIAKNLIVGHSPDNEGFVYKPITSVAAPAPGGGTSASPVVTSRQTSDISPQLTTDGGGLKIRPGGIDLNPALLDLQIRRDGNGVPLPLPLQPIETMHIDGFLPVIINIVPITNLPLLLGLDLPPQEQKPAQLTYQELSFVVIPGKERFCAREQEETFT
jgi:hypothetical protein